MTPINLLIFFISALSRVSVKLIGELYVSEIVLLLAIVFLGGGFSSLLKNKIFNTLMLFAGLWLLSQMITDVYRATPIEDWTRGWAKIVFFMADFTGIALLTRFRMDRIVVFFSGIAFAYLLQTLLFPNSAQAEGDFVDGTWKFGLSAFFNLIAAVFCATKLSRILMGRVGEYLPVVLISLVNLAFNSRSSFGLGMAAAVFGIFKQCIDHWPRLRERITAVHFVYLLIGGILFSQGIIAVYTTAASNNWLGDAAKEKYEMQAGGELGLLQGGRAESLASSQAILDSPILGHGSWARDVYYVHVLVDALEKNGIPIVGDPYEDTLIPTHSAILGSWVEAGVFGGIFWVVALIFMVIGVFNALKREYVPATFVAAMLFGFAWSAFFSPFANSARLSVAGTLCLIVNLTSPRIQSNERRKRS